MIDKLGRGSIYTKREVVEFMLDKVGYIETKDLSKIKILEPSSGNGAFVIEITRRLFESSKLFGFDLLKALENLFFVEIDHLKIKEIKSHISSLFGFSAKEIEYIHFFNEDFLILEDLPEFDLVIGNPPYVRWDNIIPENRQVYKKRFSSFSGRSDIYIPFFEKSLLQLAPEGILSFICSNRWYKSSYGKKLRKIISQNFQVNSVIDMEKAQPFQENVTAYPSIINIQNKLPNSSLTNYGCIDRIAELGKEEVKFSHKYQITYNSDSRWFVDYDIAIENRKYYAKITALGFEIGIGIATGKDSVFISDDFHGKIEEELLVPLLKNTHLKGDVFMDSSLMVIDCMDEKGKLIDLNNYPLAKKYFSDHKETLQKRHIAKKHPSNWYRTIDKIKKDLIAKPKILLPDISGNKQIFIDFGNYYPHHNLYYITAKNDLSLEALAGILMSDFVRSQLLLLSSQMNGGYPRWQSQNLKSLLIPNVTKLKKDWISNMVTAYNSNDLVEINRLMQFEIIQNEFQDSGQLVLFDPESTYKVSDPLFINQSTHNH